MIWWILGTIFGTILWVCIYLGYDSNNNESEYDFEPWDPNPYKDPDYDNNPKKKEHKAIYER